MKLPLEEITPHATRVFFTGKTPDYPPSFIPVREKFRALAA